MTTRAGVTASMYYGDSDESGVLEHSRVCHALLSRRALISCVLLQLPQGNGDLPQFHRRQIWLVREFITPTNSEMSANQF